MNTLTPWTDANEEDGWNPCGWAVDSNLVRELERKLTAVTEQRDAASAEFYRYHGLWDRATKQLETVMYQRDRLAEAIITHRAKAFPLTGEEFDQELWQVLQSLNQDHTVAANDMIAALKGGADEL